MDSLHQTTGLLIQIISNILRSSSELELCVLAFARLCTCVRVRVCVHACVRACCFNGKRQHIFCINGSVRTVFSSNNLQNIVHTMEIMFTL